MLLAGWREHLLLVSTVPLSMVHRSPLGKRTHHRHPISDAEYDWPYTFASNVTRNKPRNDRH